MNKYIYILTLGVLFALTSCVKVDIDYDDNVVNPSSEGEIHIFGAVEDYDVLAVLVVVVLESYRCNASSISGDVHLHLLVLYRHVLVLSLEHIVEEAAVVVNLRKELGVIGLCDAVFLELFPSVCFGQLSLRLYLLLRWLAVLEIGYENYTYEYVCNDTSFVHSIKNIFFG